MNKRFVTVFIFSCFFIQLAKAQTGIGTTSPHASAKLDVSSTDKGFLPPRVVLTGTSDVTTIKNAAGTSITPAEGLLVYNLGSVGLQAGYYYWNGANWATIATASSAGNGVTAMDMVKLYSKIYTANTGIVSSNGQSFTVPVSGRYMFDFSSTGYANGNFSFIFKVMQGSTLLGADTVTSANNYVHVEYNGKIEVNLQAGITYNVYVNSNGNRDNGDYDRVYYKLVAGNLPVTGQSVDYIQASLSANQALSAVGNINFNTSSGTGITITSGGFNLKANKTYKLEAAIGGTSGGYAYYGWVDNSNNLLPGGSIGAVIKAGNTHTDAPQDKAVVYFTPTVDTRVFLRVYNLSGTLAAYAPSLSTNFSSTWASIQQVGSSAFVNPWILSGTDSYNTTGKVGIGTTTPVTTLDVNGSATATTLNLTNSTIGTPSLVLRNGDAAASYSDISQIKMGWSGSVAGKSQFAHFLHSRHNSGAGGNAIDFYLSDGTADNTISSGSTKAMSIESPGNLTVAGKINLSDPSGNVVTKAAGFVERGADITLGNLKVRFAASGNMSLQVSSGSGSYTTRGSDQYITYGSASTTIVLSITTTPTYIWPDGINFAGAGNSETCLMYDTTAGMTWRIIGLVGPGYSNNFISIERIL